MRIEIFLDHLGFVLPNKEILVEAYENGLKAWNFNESLTQRPVSLLEKVVTRAECYIRGEESNAEKNACDMKECS